MQTILSRESLRQVAGWLFWEQCGPLQRPGGRDVQRCKVFSGGACVALLLRGSGKPPMMLPTMTGTRLYIQKSAMVTGEPSIIPEKKVHELWTCDCLTNGG